MNSHGKNEQHRGASWKLNKELLWANHFGVSLRGKPQYLLLGMAETGQWPPVTRSRQWFFMLKGIFYLVYYHLFGLPWDQRTPAMLCPTFLHGGPWPENVLLKFISHHVGNRQLQVRCSPWALDALQTTVPCALLQQMRFTFRGSFSAESTRAGQFLSAAPCLQRQFQMSVTAPLISSISGRSASHLVPVYCPDSLGVWKWVRRKLSKLVSI